MLKLRRGETSKLAELPRDYRGTLYYTGSRKASMMNPLFPNADDQDEAPKADQGYVLHRVEGKAVQPLDSKTGKASSGRANPAADLIRRKLDELYKREPDASQNIREVRDEPAPERSKHQQFMYELSTSGKSLAQIQTEWHAYYVGLPDDEKHQVWHEFYEANARRPSAYTQFVAEREAAKTQTEEQKEASLPTPEVRQDESSSKAVNPNEPAGTVGAFEPPTSIEKPTKPEDGRSAAAIKKQILHKVRLSEQAQKRARQHLRSLVFGLSSGVLVLFIFLFGFFNEVIIAPFIQPSRTASATPIILSSSNVAPSSTPEVIIPKINVEIPVDYSLTTTDENQIENALESGVVHYPSTVVPGQQGNAAFFGHSSNNIFNPGKYKFAFVLLHTLVPGDIFYITYNNTVYTYQVYDKQIVDPSDVSVLNNVPGKAATATLITCDPPGTSLHRLVVWGEQISPDPSGNTAAAAPTASAPTAIASNGPTLWSRFIHWLF